MPGILHFATERGWRGGENQLRLLLEGLTESGFEQHVAARRGDASAKRLAALAQIVPFDVNGSLNPVVAMRLARYCRENNIAILDAHSARAHSLALAVRGFAPELKVVVHRRVDNPPRRDPINLWKYRTQRVDRYVAISRAIYRELLALDVDPKRIRVVRSAVPATTHAGIDRVAAKQKLAAATGADPSIPFIGNASALSLQKGHDVLLAAFRLLKDRGIPFRGYIAGDGECRESLEQLRTQLELEHDVSLLGFVHEVPSLLAAFDILAVPSRNEGLGTIILDGIHAGCAVVAAQVGGIPEIIEDNATGLLVPPENPQLLAEALTRAACDESLRQRLNREARAMIERKFSVEAMVAGNLSVYRELCSS